MSRKGLSARFLAGRAPVVISPDGGCGGFSNQGILRQDVPDGLGCEVGILSSTGIVSDGGESSLDLLGACGLWPFLRMPVRLGMVSHFAKPLLTGCFGSVEAGFALTRFGFYPPSEAWLARCPVGGCPLNRVSGLLMAFF